jgi:hypothetical protein
MNLNKSNTPFVSLLKIRNQFGDSENLAIESVNELITGTTISNLNKQIVGASGLVYDFSGSTKTNRKISTYMQSGSSLVKQCEITLSGDLTNSVLQDVVGEAAIPTGLVQNAAAVIQDISDGAHFNGVVSEIAGAFMGSHSLSMSDISSLLTAHNLGATNDLNSLAKILYQNANDGKVNVYTFLSTVSSLCTQSKREVDDGELEMDTTKPLIIQSILATVKQFGSVILSTILSVLSTALGGILGVLSNIASFFFTAIGSVGSDTLAVNAESVSGLVDGPIQYLQTTYMPSVGNVDYSMTPAAVYMYGPIEQYVWKKGDNYYYNSFVSLAFDFTNFSTRVYQNKLSAVSSTEAIFNNYDADILQSTLSSGFDEILYCINNPSFATKKLALELAIVASMGQMPYKYASSRFRIIHQVLNPTGYGSTNRVYFQNCFHSSVTTEEEFRRRSYYFVKEMLWRHFLDGGGPFDDQLWIDESGISDADAMSYIQKFYTLLAPIIADRDYVSRSTIENTIKNNGDTSIIYQCSCLLNGLHECVYSDDDQIWMSYEDVDVDYSETDRLPVDRTFSIPAISGTTALKTFVILAGITIAASAAITVTGKALAKRKFIKQLKAKENLSNARQQYVSNPTSENIDAFYKAQKSYNFKAKLFGWSTYDATNDWFNDVSGASGNSSNSTNPITDSVLYKLIHG